MNTYLNSRKLHIFLAAVSSTLVFLPADLTVEAQRQHNREPRVQRELRVQEVRELPRKSKRFALIVGVDEYQDTQISRLSGAANDAKTLADALVRYAGFPEDQVVVLASDQPIERQPIRGNILKYLSNLLDIVSNDGLLVVSFAGHGIERGGRGYLCSLDAQIAGSSELLESTAVAVDTVREWILGTGVRQVLIFLDVCRNDPSGRGGEGNRLTDSLAKSFSFDVRNREVTAFATLYATDVGNVAYEYKEKKQGYFTWMLVEGLKGGAANDKGEVTLGALVKYLQEQVPKRVQLDLGREKSQKPYAVVGGYKSDELVISITPRATVENRPTATLDPAVIELELWNSIKTSADPDDFRVYLDKYVDGAFAGVARNRIRQLEVAAEPPNVPSGTLLRIRLNTPITTKTARVGMPFKATVVSPSNYESASVWGHITLLNKSGRASGRTEVGLAFDSVTLKDGRQPRVDADLVTVYESENVKKIDEQGRVETGTGTKELDVQPGRGTAAGAIIGGIERRGRGTIIVGAAVARPGVVSLYVEGKKDLILDPGTEMAIRIVNLRER